MSELVTEKDLVRARGDAVFRQHLMTDNLERLLDALKRLRNAADPGPESARQLREGVDLAVVLAERLQKSVHHRGPQAT